MKQSEDAAEAEEFFNFIAAIADRWGFDPRTGNVINAAVSPSPEQARDDVVRLAAMAIAYAAQSSPALRKRFHYLFRAPKSE